MRRLLNTLFVLSENGYLTVDGENVVVSRGKQEIGRIPHAYDREYPLFQLCRSQSRPDGSLCDEGD